MKNKRKNITLMHGWSNTDSKNSWNQMECTFIPNLISYIVTYQEEYKGYKV